MAVPARMGKVGSGTVAFGPVRYGSRGTDVMGRVGCGAAGSLQWTGEIGYETERERSGRKFAKVRRGRDACGMFRQSRSLTDRTGAVWWGVLWSGSLGHERFCLVRFGWAGLHVKARSAQEGTREIRTGAVRQQWNGSAWIDKLGIEMVRQEVCKGRARWGKLRRETVRSVLVRQQRQGYIREAWCGAIRQSWC
jgi:hypothetical protein